MRLSAGQFSARRLRDFVANLDRFASHIPAQSRDGLAESLEAVEQFLLELAPGARPAPTAVHL
jgi:hypothetical protein